MDNILYIGPYREFSGMGNASRMYIRSLIRTGHNISIRPIYNIHREYPEQEIDDEILELELNFSKKYHKTIQHCHPHQFCHNSNFDQHIGIVHLESSNYFANIIQYMSIMDKIIVGSNFVKQQIQKYIPNIAVVPEPVDIEQISEYKNNHIKQKTDTFNFYCISEWLSRKNIDKIILAFIRLSNYYENIELIIKTKSVFHGDDNVKENIDYVLSKINSLVNTKRIRKPKIVIGESNTDGIYYIHNNNHCLINISSGESFGYSVLESMAFDNNIIGPNKGAISELTKDGCGLLVNTDPTPCLDEDRQYPLYNSSLQYFDNPLINSLYENMQMAINENDSDRIKRIEKQQEKIKKYSLQSVSETLKSVLI